jgi:hypothetical protein
MIKIFQIKIILFITVIVLNPSPGQTQIQLVAYDSVEIFHQGGSLINPWAGGLNCPQFSEIDLNGDGIKDLVAFERNYYGFIKTFINPGNEGAISYIHEPQLQVHFPVMRNWMLLRDYNCDGKEDIFTWVPAGMAVFKNESETGSTPKFSNVVSLLQTEGLYGQTPLYCNTADIPAIVDIDNDGDLDILSFNELGSTVEYHKNLSMENHGDCNQPEFELKNSCWGYFSEDGNNNTVTLFDTCELNVPNPEKSTKHAGSSILAIDLNGNGVKDLLLGDIAYKNIIMLTNGGTITSSGMMAFDTAFPSNTTAVDLTVFPASYFLDANNDGLKDLIIAPNNPNTSKNFENVWLYKNEGTASIPEFVFQQNNFLQETMIDVGERSFTTFFDENADGLMDIVVGNFGYFIESGNYSSQLMLLRNIGIVEKPSFDLITNDYSNLAQFDFNGIYPAFGDLDNDGDEDMITGDENGNLHYFRNEGGAGSPASFTLSQPNYKGINVGQSAKPQIVDVNRDGLPDLLVGERSGTISYFKNIGTLEISDFNSVPTIEEFGQIDVMAACCTGYSAPFMVEDSVGNHLLYVGSEQGILYLYNNIENNLDGTFNLVDSLYLSAVNVNASCTDINNDGKVELVYGEFGGGIGLLKNGSPQVYGFNEHLKPVQHLTLFPNPAGDFVSLKFDDPSNHPEINISIFNVMGKVVLEKAYNSNENKYSVNITALGPGIYLMMVKEENKKLSFGKFVKR